MKTRLKEHKSLVGNIGKSAVADHIQQTGHNVDFDSARILIPEENSLNRKIYESLIMQKSRVFPDNQPSFHLNLFE